MKIFSALCTFLILAFLYIPAFGQDAAVRVSATWQVVKYDISATLPAAETERNVTSRATLQLRNVSSGPASSLTLRISPNATVSTVRVNDTQVDFSKSQEKLGTSDLQIVRVRMPSVAAGGNTTATVEYKLNVPENSGVASLTQQSSQFLPFSYWYPTPNSWYFARGADFAPVRLQVTAPGS